MGDSAKNMTPDGSIQAATQRISAILSGAKPDEGSTNDGESREETTEESDPQGQPDETAENEQGSNEKVEKFRLKIGDEDEELTLDDLRLGYMRQKDYTQKTMQLAENRKAFEAKQAELDNKITDLSVIVDDGSAWLISEEALSLKEVDPVEYWQRYESIQVKRSRLMKLKEEQLQRLSTSKAEKMRKEQELLNSKIPDWIDSEVKRKEAEGILQFLSETGFSEDEIKSFDDHRLFLMARKAMKLDSIMKSDPTKKQVKEPPKSATPGSAKGSDDKNRDRTKELRKKLKSSGDKSTATELIKNILYGKK